MTRFGHNVSKSTGGSKHRVDGSSSTMTVNQSDVAASSTATTPFASSTPSYTATEAVRLRRAIRRCRPLLVKDIDPVDVIDSMSAAAPTAAIAAMRTETVRESMLGLATSREEQAIAFLDRLESVCFDADGLSSSTNLAAFVAALRRHYRHVHAVLMETVRQMAEEDADSDEFDDYGAGGDDDELAAGNHGEDVDDDVGCNERRDRTSEAGRLLTTAGERRCRRERVAIAGDSVRKLLQRATGDGRDGRHRSRNGTGSASSAEILNEDHIAGAGNRSAYYYYSSMSAAAGNGSDFLDCYVVPTRGRLQRRAPWIHHASTSVGGTVSDDDDDAEADTTTYMAILTKDLVFKRIDCSSIAAGIRLSPSAAMPSNSSDVNGLSSAYVVDEECQYSPVATDHSPLQKQQQMLPSTTTTFAAEKLSDPQAADGSAAESKGEDCPPPPPVRTTSTARTLAPPPPLPPKPQNLPSRSSSLQRQTTAPKVATADSAATTAPEAISAPPSSPPLPARQFKNPSSNDRTTLTTSCDGATTIRSRQPPPVPPSNVENTETAPENNVDAATASTAVDDTLNGYEVDYEPISVAGGNASSSTNVVASDDVPSDSPAVPSSSAVTLEVENECRGCEDPSTNNDVTTSQPNSQSVADEVVRRSPRVDSPDGGNDVDEDTPEDGDEIHHRHWQQQQQLQHNRVATTRDSGIDSIVSSNGCNDSPRSQTGSAFAARAENDDEDDDVGQRRNKTRDAATASAAARPNGITLAPSLSDILISIDDDAEDFLRRQSRIEDDFGEGLRLLPRAALQYEDDYSYYEDIDLLDGGSNKVHRNATYLDPRSTSFTSADGVSLRRRSNVPPYSRSSVAMRRTSSAASQQQQQQQQQQQTTVPPLSSLAFFLQPDADRKVLPAGTLLIAETVLADGQLSSPAAGKPNTQLFKSRSMEVAAASATRTTTAASREDVARPADDVPTSVADATATTLANYTFTSGGAFRQTVLCHDREGLAYYVPAEALGRHGDPTDEPWFFPIPLSARDATLFLQREDQRGCFLVYRPSGLDERRLQRQQHMRGRSTVVYNLSVGLGRGGDVVHYPIVRNRHGDVAIAGHDHSFLTVSELVTYFRRNQSRLATRLGRSLREARLPIAAGCQYPVRFELRRSDLSLGRDEVRRTRFGPIVAGRFCGPQSAVGVPLRHQRGGEPVIVKVLEMRQSKPEDDDDFLEEALVLMGLRHENVAQLIGVSCATRPFYIVCEWSERGTLADCLRSGFLAIDDGAETPISDVAGSRHRHRLIGGGFDTRFDVCVQISSALLYLESRRYVLHRAIAARSVVVCADDPLVKLANFDRARLVSDDDYQADPEEAVFVRWAAPEVLAESRYSTKSDAWALGVLFWEIFTGGTEPYASMDAERTAVYVAEGGRLERPAGCNSDIYSIMRSLWRADPDDRLSFAALHDKIRGESSIYYTCPATAPPPPPTSGSAWTPAIGRSVSDDDRPPPPLPPPLSGRPLKSATLLPLPKKAKSQANQPTTPTSRRPLLVDVTADRAPRTPSTTRVPATAAGAAASANASNSASSDSSSIISASTTTVTGNGGADDASGAASEDLTRGEKIRKSLRKLITNKKPSTKA